MKIIKKVSLISLLLFLFLVPFSLTVANIGFFVFVLGIFINKDFYKNFRLITLSNSVKYYIFFSLAYWLWCIVSLLWSADFDRGLQLCGRYIMIVAFPMSFYLAKVGNLIKDTKLLVWTFIVGVIISSFVCLYLSYQNCWQQTENGVVFDTTILKFGWDAENAFESISKGYNNFAYIFLSHFMHPSYFSLQVLFVLIVIVSEFFQSKQLKFKILLGIIFIYFSVFVFLLQSRGVFAAGIIVLFLAVLFYAFIKKRIIILITGMLIVSFVSVKLISNSRLSWIISNTLEALTESDGQKGYDMLESSVNVRFIVWRNALQVIKQNSILGVGIGDTDTELEKQYQKNNLDLEYGTHNQYIYAQLSMGIVGLILLLAILFVPLYYGIKNRNFPLIGFSVAIMINLLFENMLTRNAGLMFIPWAMMALLMMSEEKNKRNINEYARKSCFDNNPMP